MGLLRAKPIVQACTLLRYFRLDFELSSLALEHHLHHFYWYWWVAPGALAVWPCISMRNAVSAGSEPTPLQVREAAHRVVTNAQPLHAALLRRSGLLLPKEEARLKKLEASTKLRNELRRESLWQRLCRMASSPPERPKGPKTGPRRIAVTCISVLAGYNISLLAGAKLHVASPWRKITCRFWLVGN